ncbi:hypothetical protein KFL_002120030 [Klebsormidium nitens]|uniref:PIN domain-containing protein n=1 Tax=Klebsormidium nitens TaxID=105231 RepID=A0A1Y1I666_KLENI|nr:hypothetical protein KFL_002120030 [Klebsormidium nitens]|eukprot:GAQ84909.1 hypothetical protein KFL_002120030 [Klebsormidium nitens]
MAALISSPERAMRGVTKSTSQHAKRTEARRGVWRQPLNTHWCPGLAEAGGCLIQRKQGRANESTALLCNSGAAYPSVRSSRRPGPCAIGAPAEGRGERLGQLRWQSRGAGHWSAGGTACSACHALVVEDAVAARLDVAAFLCDSLPSQLWFGGYMQEARGASLSLASGGRVTTSFTEPHALTWIAWAPPDESANEEQARSKCTEDANLAASGSEVMRSGPEKSPRSLVVGAHRPLPSAGIVSAAAAFLLVLGPVPAGAMLPVSPQDPPLTRLPPAMDVRPSLSTSLQQGYQFPLDPPSAQAGALLFTAAPRSGLKAPPAPNPLGPRLPVLVYDPDELLREPPREEVIRSGGEVKSPADLAESLQKGCGGPQCFATLFRPSAELEGLGFAGAIIFGVVSERRKSGLVQLKDLVKVALDQKSESEALVASLQQELEQQRSLLSKVLQQRGALPSIPLSQQTGQAPPREKKLIGSREWMEGLGKRGLEALAGRKGNEASSPGPALEHAYFSKMGQVHDVSKPRGLVPEGVSRVVDQTGRALGFLGEPSEQDAVARSEEDAAGTRGGEGAAAGPAVAAPAMRYVIPDTNQFLRNLPQIKRLREKSGVQTVVPLAVLKELDGLQSHPDKRAGALARKALRYMSQEMAAGVTWLRGQRRSEVRCLVGTDPAENRAALVGVPSPREAWRQTSYTAVGRADEADDELVDCCVHFSGGGGEVTLLTDDKTLQLKAMFHAVKARPITDFLAALEAAPPAPPRPVVLPASIDTEVALHQLRRYETTTAPPERPPLVSSPQAGPRDTGSGEGTRATERGARRTASEGAQLVTNGTVHRGSFRTVTGLRTTQAGRQRGEHAGRRPDSPSPAGGARGPGPPEDAAAPQEGRQTRGGRSKTGRGRATTSGRKVEADKSAGDDSGQEGEERPTKGSGGRNKTQGRRPRFARTEAGRKESSAPADMLDLAARLNAQAKEGAKKTTSSRSERSRDNERPRQQPP